MTCTTCDDFAPTVENDDDQRHAQHRGAALRRLRDRIQLDALALAPRVTTGLSIVQGASVGLAALLMRLHWIFL